MAIKLLSAGGGSVTLDVPSTAANVAINVPAGNATLITSNDQLSFRNRIINGDMRIAQRGTSHTYSNSQSGYHTIDRFFSVAFVSGGTLTISQQSVSLSDNIDAEFFLRATTTGSVAAGSATMYSETRLEDLKSFHNKTLTLSFHAKANAALTFQMRTKKNYGSGGSTEEYSGFTDIAVTTSWNKYTITISPEDLSSKTFGASNHFAVLFYWSTGQGSNQLNDNSIDITNVQLEAGSVATPFERRPFGAELALCQRYAFVYAGNNAAFARQPLGLVSGTTGIWFVQFPVPTRVTPTLVANNITSGTVELFNYTNSSAPALSAVTLGEGSTLGIFVNLNTTGATFTQGGGGQWRWQGAPAANFTFNSEL